MNDVYTASWLARLEHEERVRSLARKQRLLIDILPDDCEVWLTHVDGHGQAQAVGSLLLSVRNSLTSLRDRPKHKRELPLAQPLAGHERSGVLG